PRKRVDILDGGAFTATWSDSRGDHAVTASISRARGRLVPDSPADAALDPTLAREIQQMCEASGLIFVVDSQQVLSQAALRHFERTRAEFAYLNKDLDEVPIVFQAN